MELDLLQVFSGFVAGLIVGIAAVLLFNKLRSGSASPSSVKQEFDDYKSQVESHFEETSKKFQDMTEQYQDLYKHLSTGATTLCRPDSVAAALVEGSVAEGAPKLEADIGSEEKKVIETEDEKSHSAVNDNSTEAQEGVSEGETAVNNDSEDLKNSPAPGDSDKKNRDSSEPQSKQSKDTANKD